MHISIINPFGIKSTDIKTGNPTTNRCLASASNIIYYYNIGQTNIIFHCFPCTHTSACCPSGSVCNPLCTHCIDFYPRALHHPIDGCDITGLRYDAIHWYICLWWCGMMKWETVVVIIMHRVCILSNTPPCFASTSSYVCMAYLYHNKYLRIEWPKADPNESSLPRNQTIFKWFRLHSMLANQWYRHHPNGQQTNELNIHCERQTKPFKCQSKHECCAQ